MEGNIQSFSFNFLTGVGLDNNFSTVMDSRPDACGDLKPAKGDIGDNSLIFFQMVPHFHGNRYSF